MMSNLNPSKPMPTADLIVDGSNVLNMFRPFYRCLLLIALFFQISSLQAKELYFQPSINIRTDYNDNKRLSADSSNIIDPSAYGIHTRASVMLGARSELFDIELDNSVSINRYDSERALDSDDLNFNLIVSYNASEKNILGLSANYIRNTSLTSELDDNGTGLVQNNVNRQSYTIAPNWTYIFSDTQYLQTNYSHTEIAYDESEISQLVGYTIDNISIAYSYQWTELLRNFISVTAMSFEVPEIGSGFFASSRDTTEYSVNIGAEYQISPTWSTSLTVGQRFTNTETTSQQFNVNTLSFERVTSSDNVRGLVFSFGLDKRFETGAAGMSYSRSTNAQGNGALQVRDNLNVNFNHKVTQKLSLQLSGGISMTSDSGSEDSNNDRTFYRIQPSIRWAVNRVMNISVGYQYRMQEFQSSSNKAVSNSIFLNFNYRWDKFITQKY